MLTHYIELLRRRWSWMLTVIALAAVATALLSTVKLIVSPVYVGTASVLLLPTEAEISFSQEVGRSRNPQGLTQTFMEYMRSRPVVEAALDKLESQGTTPVAEPPKPFLIEFARKTLRRAKRLYRKLDSGKYVETSPRDKAIGRLTGAIDVDRVVDSFILLIEVRLEDPERAAAAANALAQAYVERVSSQLEQSSDTLADFLDLQISEREQVLAALNDREDELNAELGTLSIEQERESLLQAREVERQKLIDAQIDAGAIDAELKALDQRSGVPPNPDLQVSREERRALGDARKQAAKLRSKAIDEINADLEELRRKEEPLLILRRQRQALETEIGELRSRKLTAHLARSSGGAKVRLIEPATPPPYPAAPRVVRNSITAIIVALIAALGVVIGFDLLSNRVETGAHLERIAGSRALGILRRNRLPMHRRSARELEHAGAQLERRLVMLGSFEAPEIQIAGFLDTATAADSAILVAWALAAQGREVVCHLPSSVPPPEGLQPTRGRLHFAQLSDGEPAPGVVRIRCVGTLSAEFGFEAAARRSKAMIALFPAGWAREPFVHEFLERAGSAGLDAIACALVTGRPMRQRRTVIEPRSAASRATS